jgi:hypothetical protein
LQDPQELGLEVQRELADLVEQQGAAVGRLKPPARSRVAPVKLPRRCPKSSLSSRVLGIAAQLIFTKGRSARALQR